MYIWFFHLHKNHNILTGNKSLSALMAINLLISSTSFKLKLASNAFESVSLFANEFA